MKKFFIKVSYFSFIPVLVLLVVVLIQHLIPDNAVLDSTLESKIASLVIDMSKINVIIAGDSRAERQLSPKIIKEQTGFNAINIATSSCDLLTTVTAIKQKYVINSKTIFVISASSFQINDGAVDPGYLSLKCFHDMSLFDKFWLYKGNLSALIRIQDQLIDAYRQLLQNKESIDTSLIKEAGFLGIDGNVDTKSDIENTKKNHAWYKNVNNNNAGARWSLFKRSLHEIGSMNSVFILYQPPVSHYWKTNTSGSFIDIAEKQYSEKVKQETKQYKNIIFIDFYNNDFPGLNDSMFYDIQHLNRQGAAAFSAYMSKEIMEAYQTHLNAR